MQRPLALTALLLAACAATPERSPPPVAQAAPAPTDWSTFVENPRDLGGLPTVRADDLGATGGAPLVRIPPSSFERCMTAERRTVTVAMVFDITPEGRVANLRVRSSDDACYNRAAVRAVGKWRYEPVRLNGEPAARRDVKTMLTFQGMSRDE